MARIMELFVGRDGHVRVAKRKTQIDSAQLWKPVDAKKEATVRTKLERQVKSPERLGM